MPEKENTMPKQRNFEVIGLFAEIVGLAFVLLAAWWQTSLTDWLDTFPAKSQYFIQETANLALLQGIERTAVALNEQNAERKTKLLNDVSDISKKAMVSLINLRDGVTNVEKNQTPWFKLVRHILFFLGAFLIIVGKVLTLKHKSRAASLG